MWKVHVKSGCETFVKSVWNVHVKKVCEKCVWKVCVKSVYELCTLTFHTLTLTHTLTHTLTLTLTLTLTQTHTLVSFEKKMLKPSSVTDIPFTYIAFNLHAGWPDWAIFCQFGNFGRSLWFLKENELAQRFFFNFHSSKKFQSMVCSLVPKGFKRFDVDILATWWKIGRFFQSSGHPVGGITFLQRNFKFSSQVKKKQEIIQSGNQCYKKCLPRRLSRTM